MHPQSSDAQFWGMYRVFVIQAKQLADEYISFSPLPFVKQQALRVL